MGSPRSVIINFVGNDRVTEVAKGIGKSFDKLNDQAKQMAGPAMAAAGAAAGGAFAAGIASAIQLDSARGKLEAQLGLTKDESKRIGGVAGKLYASAYGESMEQVQTAVTSVIQNMEGMKTASSEALQQTTARAMDVATVMDEEVGATTRAVAQMMKTGLAKNSQEAFDILVAGTQKGANKAQDLLDTFNEYGTQFRKLGLDGQTAMGLIQQGLQGGARDADIVADAFKEFSIRAIDGSDSTIAGYKALGLNAKEMAAQIAGGGPKAAAGLDMVLDRLRGVKDPAAQSAIAVQLFGTQAEDLGKALFGLDPSAAVAALGNVSGAADKAGEALGGTTQAKFTAFMRTLQQDVTGALGATIGWFQKHETTAKVLAIAVGALTTAYIAYNVVAAVMAVRTALVTETSTLYAIKTGIANAATKAWAAGQWLLNAAMTANPIGIIIVAIVALVAAVVLAYKNSETFRSIVQAAWAGIKDAAAAAWGFLKPILSAIGEFLTGNVVPAFQMAWTVAKAVWDGIMTAVRAAWAVVGPIFTAIATVLKTVLGVAFTLLENVVKAAWIAIQIHIKVMWAAIKLVFDAIVLFVKTVLAPVFTWLYNNVIKPAWEGIKAFISLTWTAIRTIFTGVKTFIETVLAPVFTWLWRTVIVPVWEGIKTAISTVWNSGIRPVFDALRSAVGKVRDAFGTAVSGIKSIWDKLINIAKKPVNFVIGLYNKGIVGLVNKIADFAGIGTRLSEIPTLARGGTLGNPASAAPMMTNGPMAIVGEGRRSYPEYVIPTDPRYRSRAQDLWAAAGRNLVGRGSAGGHRMGGEGIGFAAGGSLQGLAAGGIIGDFVGGLKNFAFSNVAKAAESVLNQLIGLVPGSGTFRDVIAGIPTWIKDKVLAWIKDKVGASGKGIAAAMNFAQAQNGKPYLWGGVGPGGFDCSGLMSAITNVIHGNSPYSRLFTTHSFDGTSGPGGFVRNLYSQFMVGVTNAGVGHMAGTLGGMNVESSGSGGVQVGGGARGAFDGLFPYQYGLTADTGALTLRPGWNPPTFNGTGRPEMLSTPANQQPIVLEVHPGGSGLDDLFISWLRNNLRSRGLSIQVAGGGR